MAKVPKKGAVEPKIPSDAFDSAHDLEDWNSDSRNEASRIAAGSISKDALNVARRLRQKSISHQVLIDSVRFVELLAVFVIGLAGYFALVYPDVAVAFSVPPLFVAPFLASIMIQAADGYRLHSLANFGPRIGRIFAAWTAVFAFFAVALFFLKVGDIYSRAFTATWFAGGFLFFTLFRAFLSFKIRGWTKEGRLERRAVIVGGGGAAADLIRELEVQPGNDIRICGVFDDRADDRSPASVAGYRKLGNVNELVDFARVAEIDMLIVTIPLTAEKRVLELLKKLWVLPVDIHLSAHTDKLNFQSRRYTYVGKVPFVSMLDKPIANWKSIQKRFFDLIFASIALVVLSPLMLATMFAIRWESKGPVIFRQKRHGFKNEIIDVLKFRSMYHEMADPDAKSVVTKGDPRVTRVGRFIRKTSIDELPQLINVLKGELSLVGPRPHAVNAHTDSKLWCEVVDGYYARHKVKPGVTGWAQINGWRGEIDTPDKLQARVEHDVYYIENWSILLDLKILFLTPFRLLNTENAY
ncbi:MAG: undecaprenyl-phosphate glucose phosphotransferase [Stappiaceae bacterium]